LIPTGHTQVLYDKAEKAKFKIKVTLLKEIIDL
jgi:hypothetical protein